MNVVVYEPGHEARVSLCEELSRLGCRVAPFADARTAFLFLLGRLHELDGVIVSTDSPGEGAWLMQRLDLLPDPLSVVTYSNGDAALGAKIQESLLHERGNVPQL